MDKLVTWSVTLREYTNGILGPIRRKKLQNARFTIFSNNCWAGHVYRYFNIPYNSPTIGLYFFADDYLRFVKNPRHYLSLNLDFIDWKQSKRREELSRNGGTTCPIAKLDDIEIVFLHYSSEIDAREKWERRKSRINWDNLFVKFTEQNECSYDLLEEFDKLPYKDKFVFVHKHYGLESEVVFQDYINKDEVLNDTAAFDKYVNIINWLNHKPFKVKQ